MKDFKPENILDYIIKKKPVKLFYCKTCERHFETNNYKDSFPKPISYCNTCDKFVSEVKK